MGYMKTKEFDYEVKIIIEFTQEEIDFLMERSRLHYDAKCRSVSAVGGFLYGIDNAHRIGIEEHTLTSLQLGTLAKILEMAWSIEDDMRRNLSKEIHGDLRSISDEYNRLTKEEK
jgi:hypothetical protein